MKRPEVKPQVRPRHIDDIPCGPCFQAGFLVSENADWRVFKPILDQERCTMCLRCYIACPEGVIFKTDDRHLEIDERFCKGCGICAKECKFSAIQMVKEGDGSEQKA